MIYISSTIFTIRFIRLLFFFCPFERFIIRKTNKTFQWLARFKYKISKTEERTKSSNYITWWFNNEQSPLSNTSRSYFFAFASLISHTRITYMAAALHWISNRVTRFIFVSTPFRCRSIHQVIWIFRIRINKFLRKS